MSEDNEETTAEEPTVDPWAEATERLETVGFSPDDLDAMELRKAHNLAAALTSPDSREDALSKLLANELGGLNWQEAQKVIHDHREAQDNPWAPFESPAEAPEEDFNMAYDEPASQPPEFDPRLQAAVQAEVAKSQRQILEQVQAREREQAQIAEFHQSIEKTAVENGLDDTSKTILMQQAAALGSQPGMSEVSPTDLVGSAWGQLDAWRTAAATQAAVDQVTEAPETTTPSGPDGSDVNAVPQTLNEAAAEAAKFFSE